MPESAGNLMGAFGWLDWTVVIGVLALTTLLGERLAGRQSDLRDFFLGGRRLPWLAVCASIIATEISAVTFISLPSVVFKPGGNLTYLQLALFGSLGARCLIAWKLVPAYFEREFLSPYEYMAARLGPSMRSVTTVLFSVGGVLGQSARVYLTAVVLEVLLWRELQFVELQTGLSPLVTAVLGIGLVAVAWTWMGGMRAVIWTDAILFMLFLAGAVVSLWAIARGLEGGLAQALETGWEAGKLRLLDFDTDPTKSYTVWTAAIAATWSGVGSYGTDQLIAQRLFCCKDVRDARRAIVGSYAAVLVILLVGMIGVGLFSWYQVHPLEGAALALYDARPDRIFPIFVVEELPAGLKGLILAGVFAAAISSLDSILAALSQTTLSAIWLKGDAGPGGDTGRFLRISRVLVALWAVVLCAAAVACETLAGSYASILDLALGISGYTGGALIAGFALAVLPGKRDASGYVWAAPLSVVAVFAVSSHQSWGVSMRHPGGFPAPETLVAAYGLIVASCWFLRRRGEWMKGLSLVLGVGVLWLLARHSLPDEGVLAFPWWMPLGSLFAFVYGLLLTRRRESS